MSNNYYRSDFNMLNIIHINYSRSVHATVQNTYNTSNSSRTTIIMSKIFIFQNVTTLHTPRI